MGATDLDQFRHAAQQQAAAERQTQAVLQNALRSPHTITRFGTVAVALDGQGREKVLMIGTPDGHRYDLPIGGPLGVAVLKALQDEPAAQEAVS